jgi:iron complex transport system substrate-binding protein
MKKFVLACLSLLLLLLAYQQIRHNRTVPSPTNTNLRLISLSPTLTEILFELGVGESVVGVTTYCAYPPEAQKKEKIGDFVNPNFEKMLALKPDLIFAERWSSSKIVTRLKEASLNVVEVDSPRSIEEIYQVIRQVGQAVKKEDRARSIEVDMRRRIDLIRAQAERMPYRPKIYIEIDLPSWTVGRNSYTSEAVTLCGARNIFEDLEKPALQVSKEVIIERNPDIILSFDAPAAEYLQRPGWSRVKAIQQRKIIDDVGRNLLSHGNHRLIAGMEQLQARLLQMR